MRGSEFSELSAFVAVAEHRNFTRAAAHLGISTPTLSQSVRRFEERLGVRLLNRTTRSVSLTPAGERLLADSQPILDGIGKAIERVNSFLDKPIGTLRLSVSRPASVMLVVPMLPRFLAAYPEIKIEMSADDTHIDIVGARFDAGIRIGERIAKDMVAVRLIDKFPVVAMAAPSYLAAHAPPEQPEELSRHRCVHLRSEWDGGLQPWVFEKEGRQVEVAIDSSVILNDMNLVMQAVLGGVGIGYLGAPLTAHYVASGRLVPLLDGWHGQVSGVFLYYSSRRQVPGPLRAFIDFMRNELKGFAPVELDPSR